MNKEEVSVTIHRQGDDRVKKKLPAPENLFDDQQLQKKNSHPSRRWLVSELERKKEKNSELAKQLDFQKELSKSLLEAKNRLEKEMVSLRSQRVVGVHENEAIRERNKQLSQDVFLMKNILVKLNFELERYQDKLRKYENHQLKIELNSEKKHEQVEKRSTCFKTEWIHGEMTIIAPLLIAYEESLREKEDLIDNFRKDMERISGKMKEILKENSELRAKIMESETQGEVNYSDWMGLRKELAVSVEQNQLLSRQAKLAQSKIMDLKAVFQAKLNEICCERDEAISKLNKIRTDFLVLKGRSSTLEEEYERLKEDTADRMPKSIHTAYIAECKRLLNELKSRHTEERTALLRRIADLEQVEPPYQKSSSSAIAEKLKETESRLAVSEERRQRCERKRSAMKERMDGLVNFSKELIMEHEGLLKGVNGELCLNANLSSRVQKLKLQLKDVELETLEQIKILDENITSQVEKVSRVRNERDLELLKLKEELQSKHNEIEELKGAAKQREEEMKLVWEAAISDKKS